MYLRCKIKIMNKSKFYLKGLKDGIGIGVAYIPFGITIGLISKNFGMSTPVDAVLSFGIYAGAAESMLLKAVYEQHSTIIEILFAIFMINLRYLLLNITVFRKLKDGTSIFEKILMGIGLTDETVTYFNLRGINNIWYAIGLNTIPYFAYGLSSVCGSLFGNLIPEMFRTSMSFVLYATYFSLIISALKDKIKYIEVVGYVIIMRLLFYLPILNKLSTGWIMIIIMITTSTMYALRHFEEDESND